MSQQTARPLWERLPQPPVTGRTLLDTVDIAAYDAVYAPVKNGDGAVASFILQQDDMYYTVDGMVGGSWDVEVSPTGTDGVASQLLHSDASVWHDLTLRYSELIGTFVNDVQNSAGFGSMWLVVDVCQEQANEKTVAGEGKTVFEMNKDIAERDDTVVAVVPMMNTTLHEDIDVDADVLRDGPDVFTIDDIETNVYHYPVSRLTPSGTAMDEGRNEILDGAITKNIDPSKVHEDFTVTSESTEFA